jgi:DNA-directed RNA polymerase specialized sigma24 family protein
MSGYCDKYRKITDNEFIDAIFIGDEGAEGCFREIFIDQPVRSLVFKKYYWLKTEVEDICQELWLYFKSRDWKLLSNFKDLPVQPEAPKLRSYVYGAISRRIVKQYKNKFAPLLIPLIFDDGCEMEIPTSGADRAFERKDLQKRAENLVEILFNEALTPDSKAGLSDAEQKIVRMRLIMQPPLSSKETAASLKMALGSVDTALFRAKKKIRDFYISKNLIEDVREVLRDAAAS